MKVTFLGKCQSHQHLTKLYGLGDDGTIVKLSDYDAGKLFKHTSVEVNNIVELRRALISYSNGDYIRVFGDVREEFATHNVVKRRNTYLKQPEEGVRLLYLDLDGKDGSWQCDAFDMRDTDSLAIILKAKLSEAGLAWLCDYDCIFMWSQSAWTPSPLRGHVYWILDEGIDLELLRHWGKAHNELHPQHRLDAAVWRTAQPDFIGRRRLEPEITEIFPLDKDRFVLIPGDMLESVVPTETLRSHIEAEVQNPLAHYSETASVALGSTWQDTLLRVGKSCPDGEINGWCYRAAAQAVQELGSKYVMANLQALTEEFHERAWASIARNTKGTRGDENDRNTYDHARFRQYLTSAASKGFGEDKDARVDLVMAALKRATDTGDLEALFSKDTLAHCAILRNRWPAAWQEVQYIIKTDLKTRVSIRDFRQSVERMSNNANLKNPGEFTEGGDDEEESGKVRLMHKVLSEFDWILDQNGTRWAGIKSSAGNYSLFSLNALKDIFYYKAQNLDPSTPQQFGKMCLSYVLGGLGLSEDVEERDEDQEQEETEIEDKKENAPMLKWRKCIVGLQHYRDKRGIFWDLGKDQRGVSRVLHITKAQKTIITKNKCFKNFGILWHNPQQVTSRSMASQGNGFADIDLLWKYILCEEEDRIKITGWLVNTLLCGDTQLIIELLGPPNSGKSSAGDFLRDLLDPVDPDVTGGRARKGLEGLAKIDKYRAIQNNAVVYEDNKSGIKADMQNLFCKVCTGSLVDVRILYSASMEQLWLKRPVILTGLDVLITQPDLVSRSLRIFFSEEAGKTAGFKTHSKIVSSWKSDRPKILRALAELTQQVYARLGQAQGRRGVFDLAMLLLLGDEAGYARIQQDRFASAFETIQSSPFCLAWTAFVQERFYSSCVSEEVLSTRQWLDAYENWWLNKSGQTVEIELSDCARVEVVLADSGGNFRLEKAVPSSSRGLGSLINKYANELKLIVGIQGHKRVGKYKHRLVKFQPFI